MAVGTEHRRQVEGVEMRWLEHGSGAPVVLVHGIPTSPELWRHVLPRVAGARLLAWEMTGFGRSWAEGDGRDISVKAQAGRLLAFLDALGIERAVLVGHDLGGGVAQIAAARAPERCAGLVLTNAISYDSWPVAPVKAIRAAGPVVERMPPAIVKGAIMGLLAGGHDSLAKARESHGFHARGYDHPGGAAALVRQVRALRTEDTLEIAGDLPRLQVPAELVWGSGDPFQPIRYGRRLAADLRAELDEIPRARHFTPENHPDRIAAAIGRVVAATGERAEPTGPVEEPRLRDRPGGGV